MTSTYAPPSLTVYGSVDHLTAAAQSGGGQDNFFFNSSSNDGTGGAAGDIGAATNVNANFKGQCTYQNGSTGTATLIQGDPNQCSPGNLPGWDGSNLTGQEGFLD